MRETFWETEHEICKRHCEKSIKYATDIVNIRA
jgi:hypothetical protein